MKILHINIGGPYNDDMSYQGVILPKENKKAGHDVTVITSCFKWKNNKIIEVPEEDIIKYGIRYIRIKYEKIISPTITEKIRKSKKLKKYIEEIKPDIILNHDIQTFELLTVSNYKKRNPNVRLFADSHTDKNNSATSWISLNILHKIVYRSIINMCKDNFEKILCISYETMDFLKDVYKIEEDILEFYPLGGNVISKEEKKKIRYEKKLELGFSEKDILLCHSGKMDIKKRTCELLQNFLKTKNPHLKLLIIGVFEDALKDRINELIIKDNRVTYLGWKSSDELIKYIAASDLYVQPGSQSATMQNALCVGTPVLFENNRSHEAYMAGNSFTINNYYEMEDIFSQISNNPEILDEMSKRAFELAYDMLDYKKLANRITK